MNASGRTASQSNNEILLIIKNIRIHLMNGVSHMLPLVVGSGILMAVAIMMNGQGSVPETGFSADLWTIGATGMGLMVPIFAAYIAASIADRPGIAPGLVGGMMASNVGAGFLGGIAAGIFAGILCYYLKKIPLHKSIRSLGPIMIIPIAGILLTSGLIYWVIGIPISGLMDTMTIFLTSMSEGNKIVLGLIVGAMIAFDLGGPINKVAFGFMVASIGSGIYTYAGPCAVAICLPPLGAGVSSLLLKNKFTKEEQNAGLSSIVMGVVGISEGAITYTANDPIRMIPINMISTAIATALAYVMNVSCNAAWGGLIVLPVCGNRLGYIISIVVGVGIYVALCALLKSTVAVEAKVEEDEDIDFEIEF